MRGTRAFDWWAKPCHHSGIIERSRSLFKSTGHAFGRASSFPGQRDQLGRRVFYANRDDLVRGAALDVVQNREPPSAGIVADDFAENRPIELEFVDFAGGWILEAAVVALVRIRRTVKVLVSPARDANGPRRSHPVIGSEEGQIIVEDLNPRVAAVSDVDVAVRVG